MQEMTKISKHILDIAQLSVISSSRPYTLYLSLSCYSFRLT